MTQKMSRKSFLQLAAGSAIGAAMIHMPAISWAAEAEGAKRVIKTINLKDLPRDAIESAKASPLIHRSYEDILKIVGTIRNEALRSEVLKLIKDPRLSFLSQYTSASSRSSLYAALAAEGLVDASKIDEAHILPPISDSVQPFMTAPGSGYGSHHPYPGGLATHVDSNLKITAALCKIYDEVYMYRVDRDMAIAAQALHDIAKPYVFQWQKDGSSLKEYTIAGQGAHHVISLAEVIYRNFPADEVIAQACAHGAPSNPKEEADVASWLNAAAIMAGKDPVAYGLLDSSKKAFPRPHRQEGYIVHLGDHDWVLSSPAAQKSVKMLERIAKEKYGITDAAEFNAFRNYVGSQLAFMFLNYLEGEKGGFDKAYAEVAKVVIK